MLSQALDRAKADHGTVFVLDDEDDEKPEPAHPFPDVDDLDDGAGVRLDIDDPAQKGEEEPAPDEEDAPPGYWMGLLSTADQPAPGDGTMRHVWGLIGHQQILSRMVWQKNVMIAHSVRSQITFFNSC